MKRLFCILLLLALSLSACTEAGEDGSSGGSSGGSSSTAAGTASDIARDASELFTDRDYNDDYAEDGSVHITLNGDSAEADSDAVRISGTIVTVTEAATYVISGTLDDGIARRRRARHGEGAVGFQRRTDHQPDIRSAVCPRSR